MTSERDEPAGRLYLGLDVGGTKSAVVVGDERGSVRDRRQWPSQASRGPDAMIQDLIRHGRDLLRQHPDTAAAGVSIGGPLDADRGVILGPPNLPGWDDIPLAATLARALNLPVRVEHDAAACCLAEHLWGAGRGASRLIYLTCGTGCGAGIVIDGRIYRGAGGQNVEVGHVRYRDDGPEAFGKRGSFEAFCAGGGLGRLAHWHAPDRWSEQTRPEDLVRAGLAGDDEAMAVLRINARAIGDLCAWLGDLLRPDMILLGSLARHIGRFWVDDVVARFTDEALPATARRCVVQPAGLGDRLQDCSALAVARSAATADPAPHA